MASGRHQCYVVDDTDNVIVHISRSELTEDVRWRNTGIYLFNDNGEVLLARRHPSKKEHANLWGPSASGTVEVGESYQSNIEKETQEELGITPENIEFCGNFLINHGTAKRFTGMFKGVWNGEISEVTLEPDEVSDVKWVSLEWLITDLSRRPEKYVPGLVKTLPAIGIELGNGVSYKKMKDTKGHSYYI